MTSTSDTSREALHRVAEHVLAAAQARAGAGIRLRYVPGGFETLIGLPDGRRIAVIGDRLVERGPGGHRETPLTTVGAAARFIGVDPGLPPGIYPAVTTVDRDVPLAVDADAAREFADWYGLADEALRRFSTEITGEATQPVLWPEHFDLGISLDAVNYGASPGDHHEARPYLYVGPHAGPPQQDQFWNAPFGAVRTRADVRSVEDAVGFFREGRERLH